MIDHTWYIRPEGVPEREGAGGVVVRRARRGILVALLREGRLPGYMLPKGGVEAGENPEAAARREVVEETGLTSLRLLADLGVRERLNYAKTRWSRTRYFLFLAGEGRRRTAEATTRFRLAWHPLDRLPPMMWPEQAELLETNRRRIMELVENV